MDPLSILCSILTITDASKKISNVCTYYVAHAKNAPKELQTVIEDVHALNGTMTKLDSLVKSTKRTQEIAYQFDFWELPLARLEKYAKELEHLVSQLDMRVGFFHELGFRARWARGWRAIEILMEKVRIEKGELHLATSMVGTEIIGTVFEIVNERLPKNQHVRPPRSNDGPNRLWEKVDQKHCSPDQMQAFILQHLGEFIDWHMAQYEYPSFDNPHQDNIVRSAEYMKEPFLESNVYQAWKTRKTRGPGLLCATGHAVTGKSTLCCRTIQDLQSSLDSDVGIAYFYFGVSNYPNHSSNIVMMLQFWIIQLASQRQSLPVGLLTENLTLKDFCNNIRPAELSDTRESCLKFLLFSLLAEFRRTFLLIDVFRHSSGIMVNILKDVLQQDLGDVSIAIFSQPDRSLEPLLKIADVAIRLTQIEPDLGQYTRYKIDKVVKPMLVAANLDYDDGFLTAIKAIISGSADGLYLGVDVLIDSLLTTIRTGGNVKAFLRQTRENNEIMLQRDPESMKQKAFGIETPNPTAGPSNSHGSRKALR